MSLYQSFIIWTLFLQVNLDIFIYSERYVQMWFLRVGINSKDFMVEFWKLFEVAKATGLLFLPQMIYWSKWCDSNRTGLRFPKPFQSNLFHQIWITGTCWVEFWEMFEVGKAYDLLFLPQMIYWSKWYDSNGTVFIFHKPFH